MRPNYPVLLGSLAGSNKISNYYSHLEWALSSAVHAMFGNQLVTADECSSFVTAAMILAFADPVMQLHFDSAADSGCSWAQQGQTRRLVEG